ncbi:Hypothetical predicted protein, partial [Paramuricea clavata]
PYPEPYLFINDDSGIHAIDLLTDDKTVVIPGLKKNYGMAIDKAEMKIYFRNGNSISRANFDGSGVEIFLKNVEVWKITIDWIERKMIWVSQAPDSRVYVMYLDGKGKSVVTKARFYNEDIAVDPTVG